MATRGAKVGRNSVSPADEELNSFPYDTTIAGKEHHYRITQNHEHYGVEQDGAVIAEVAHGKDWQQISGKPLGKELLESTCQHIEAQYL